MAIPCSSGGKLSRRIACDTVSTTPPPNPCTMRNSTIEPRLPASPHAIDAAVKSSTLIM